MTRRDLPDAVWSGRSLPGDAGEMLPGEEKKAIEIARHVKQVALATLASE